MTFGKWSEKLHYDPEQLLRLERARQIQNSDIQVDTDGQCGVITGSKKANSTEKHTYDVTVNSCSCTDFAMRQLPCKHIYRLAIECDLINSYDESKLCEAIGAIENLSTEAQLFLKTVLGIVAPEKYGSLWVDFDEDAGYITAVSYHTSDFVPVPLEWLTTNPYLELVPINLEMLSSVEIGAIIENLGIEMDEELLRPDNRQRFLSWVKSVVPTITEYLPRRLYVYALFHQKVMFKVLQYLRRKFDSDTFSFEQNGVYRTIEYPSGAEFPDGLFGSFCSSDVKSGDARYGYFPNDEITGLLTQYGYNRCLKGFEVIIK